MSWVQVPSSPDFQTHALALSLETTSDGKIDISLPRSFVDINGIEEYSSFSVTADGQKVTYDQHQTPTDRNLVIPFKIGTKTLEIIPKIDDTG